VGQVSAGCASRDITPPPGLDIAGSLSPIPSQGTGDPLVCKALVLDDGSSRAALVAADLLGLERSEVLRTRQLVAARTGIPAEAVMLSCTHTHQGPTSIHYSACRWPGEYMAELPGKIADAVASAAQAVEAVEWGHTVAREGSVGHYRRVRLADGRVRNTWQLPSDAGPTTPLGEIDPDLPILALRAAEGLRALVLNYSCHATCAGDGRWSANYPGRLAAELAETLGLESGRVLYTAGAAANVNPAGPYRDARDFGRQLASVVPPSLPSVAWRRTARLVARERPLRLPARERPARFPFDEVDAVWNNTGSQLGAALALKYYADEWVKMVRRGPVPEETALQVIALDDLAFVSIPGELFVELGREIERRSPFACTAIVTLANDWVGYLPHRRAFEEGGYETLYASQSRLAPEAGELVVEAAVRLLAEARAAVEAAR
jgi:hypothetical protein